MAIGSTDAFGTDILVQQRFSSYDTSFIVPNRRLNQTSLTFIFWSFWMMNNVSLLWKSTEVFPKLEQSVFWCILIVVWDQISKSVYLDVNQTHLPVFDFIARFSINNCACCSSKIIFQLFQFGFALSFIDRKIAVKAKFCPFIPELIIASSEDGPTKRTTWMLFLCANTTSAPDHYPWTSSIRNKTNEMPCLHGL